MDRRRSFPWGWVLLTIMVVVIVGAVAYYLGTTQAQPTDHVRTFHALVVHRGGHGFGILGFWLPVLVIALLVGILAAAIARPSRPTETFEDWHRRAHGEGPVGHGGPQGPTHTEPSSGVPPASSVGMTNESSRDSTSA